jgi:hypothetical protein
MGSLCHAILLAEFVIIRCAAISSVCREENLKSNSECQSERSRRLIRAPKSGFDSTQPDKQIKENFNFKFTIDHRFLLLRLHLSYPPQYV